MNEENRSACDEKVQAAAGMLKFFGGLLRGVVIVMAHEKD